MNICKHMTYNSIVSDFQLFGPTLRYIAQQLSLNSETVWQQNKNVDSLWIALSLVVGLTQCRKTNHYFESIWRNSLDIQLCALRWGRQRSEGHFAKRFTYFYSDRKMSEILGVIYRVRQSRSLDRAWDWFGIALGSFQIKAFPHLLRYYLRSAGITWKTNLRYQPCRPCKPCQRCHFPFSAQTNATLPSISRILTDAFIYSSLWIWGNSSRIEGGSGLGLAFETLFRSTELSQIEVCNQLWIFIGSLLS